MRKLWRRFVLWWFDDTLEGYDSYSQLDKWDGLQ